MKIFHIFGLVQNSLPMKLGDLKYLLAYLLPLVGFLSIYYDGWGSFIAVVYGFIIIPILEMIFPPNVQNLSPEEAESKSTQTFFDVLLFLNIPLVFGLLFYYFYSMPSFNGNVEWIGNTTAVGFVMAASGINVAHEIGHKSGAFHQFSSQLLLLPSLYMHFNIEHNLGHHLRVATLEDPATSRKNEIVYFFWIRSTFFGYLHAWEISNKLAKKAGHSIFSLQNKMVLFTLIQALFLLCIYYFFGPMASLMMLVMATISFLTLETINYVEHYGLLRKKKPSGQYERVTKKHSWNSDHILGRIMLYELTRHSDHHYKANKKYQVLDHYDESPQLPLGYPGSIVLALIPPLWFKVMHKRLDQLAV